MRIWLIDALARRRRKKSRICRSWLRKSAKSRFSAYHVDDQSRTMPKRMPMGLTF
jgi:hypothetical protein